MQNKPFSFPRLICRMIVAWLLAACVEYLLLPTGIRDLSKLDALAQMSLIRLLGIGSVVFTILTALACRFHTEKTERLSLAVMFAVLCALSLSSSFTWPFLYAVLLLLTVTAGYGIWGWNGNERPVAKGRKSRKLYVWLTAGLAVLFFLFVSAWGVCRVFSFSTPSFDFGLFAQMFHSMKTTGLPMTTLERDGLLSHFAVHVSPIYYLMLPFYWLIPHPATLQVLQAAVLASAVIPLWKLAKHHGLPGWGRLLCCALLLLYPAYSGGTSYDLHENCFLTPLILWLLYGIDRKNIPLTAVAAVLTLSVKEDAAVYVAVAALWLIVKSLLHREKSNRDLIVGAALLAVSLGWFFAVTGYLANHGDGVMTNRYKNFMYDGSDSLITVVKAVLLSPMKALYECVDPEKLKFIALTLLPLLGLPLLTRRYERYLLLIPYVLVNLMSDYTYQHDIFFQYTYGSSAFLFYLTLVNLADLNGSTRKCLVLLVAVAVSAVCFGTQVVPKAKWYPEKLMTHRQEYAEIREELGKIPQNAAVASATFYTTHLSARDVLYDIKYCTREHLMDAEYVVLDPGVSGDFKKYADEEGENGYENLRALLEEQGYDLQSSVGTKLEIYYKE